MESSPLNFIAFNNCCIKISPTTFRHFLYTPHSLPHSNRPLSSQKMSYTRVVATTRPRPAKALIPSTKAAIQYVQTISHSTFLLTNAAKPRLIVILRDLVKQVQISLNTSSITPQLRALLSLMGMSSLRAPGGRQNKRQLQQIKTNEAAYDQALKEWSTKINAQGGMK